MRGRPTDTGEARTTALSIRVTRAEQEALERVQRERGDATLSETIRAIPSMLAEERERCAKIAESWDECPQGAAIAEEIRRGP